MEEKEGVNVDEFKHANISLILDSYADIFSSFDPRPYSEKAVSVDFVSECKRAARDINEFDLELNLAVPKTKRNLVDEARIKRRLREHFHKHFVEKEKEMKSIRKGGISWVVLGALLILGIGWGYLRVESEAIHTIIAIFEVPGWFLVWEGLGKVFLESRKAAPDYEFYKKMSNVRIVFRSY
ncbi:hypothetical protein FJZ17_02375 [Candidatus Pacearchaeota archaeon]|nr:hypothetical protein [Candidatus Pacearchaeota archaeon]